IGAYRRPLSDARTTGVKFAAECLGNSAVPGDDAGRELRAAGAEAGSPAWLSGVPADRGSDWTFEDVREHYMAVRTGVDPDELRRDGDRYLDVGRAAL